MGLNEDHRRDMQDDIGFARARTNRISPRRSPAENRAAAIANIRERNLREFHVTIQVDPQAQDDPDLRYQLARAKHNGERIGIVVGGFNYDVGLTLVQLGSLETEVPSVPLTFTCPRCGGEWGEDVTCQNCCDDDGNPRSR